MSKVAVIIAGGGKGERFEGQEKKTFARLDGRPVVLRTLELFINREDVCQTVLVVAGDDLAMVKEKFGANLGFMGVKLVGGGDHRWESVQAGLAAIPADADLVAVHDAVRPCVTSEQIDAVFAEAGKSGAAILATPLTGTIKRVSESGVVDETVSREGLWEAQTPQVFKAELLRKAYAERTEEMSAVTDDAQLVEAVGHDVSVVVSNATNLKITTKADMLLANAIVKSRPAKPAGRMGAFEEAQW